MRALHVSRQVSPGSPGHAGGVLESSACMGRQKIAVFEFVVSIHTSVNQEAVDNFASVSFIAIRSMRILETYAYGGYARLQILSGKLQS